MCAWKLGLLGVVCLNSRNQEPQRNFQQPASTIKQALYDSLNPVVLFEAIPTLSPQLHVFPRVLGLQSAGPVLLLLTCPSCFPPAGCCAGQDDILPQGPVDAKLGTNVTLATLLNNPPYSVMFWNYLDGEDSVNVATYSEKKVTLGEAYVGRASLNVTNGFLQLGPLKSTDSGQYSLTVISGGKTQTASTRLEVLGELQQ